jgi:uncharacterized protein (DUF433 family)
MAVRINHRGRGPEIQGTRVTVYRVMDYVRAGDPPECIAEELGLTEEQVRGALQYIDDNRAEVDAAYDAVMSRVNQRNPEWVEEGSARTWDELRQRLMARSAGESASGQKP